MEISEIIVKPVLSPFFQEIGYVLHRKNAKECIVIDPGLEPDEFLKLFMNDHLTPIALLITHGHGDHIGGIMAIRAKWKSVNIYIGELEQEKLIDPAQNLSAGFGVDLIAPKADVLLKDGDELELAGIPLEIRHVPGHSKGHVVFCIPTKPQRMLFVGDVIFQGSIGRSDFPDGDSAIQIPMIRSKILTFPDETILYPGHGDPTTVGAERQFNPFLQ